VSVLEEWRSGPNPGVRIPLSVYTAINDDRLLPIAELDEGFLRPTYEGQVIVSYMQAGLVCQYIDREYGAERLSALLYKYRDGYETGEAIQEVLGISPREFDGEFNDFIRAEHGAILDNLDDWQRTQVSIAQKASEGDWSGIIELAKHLLDLLPAYVEPDSPYLSLARAHDELGQRQQAIAVLEEFWRRGGYDPAALKRLAGWFDEENRGDEAIAALQSVNLVDPLDQELHGTLGDMLLEANRAEEALMEYSVALALDPHDKAGSPVAGARRCTEFQAGAKAATGSDARRFGQSTLGVSTTEIFLLRKHHSDPFFRSFLSRRTTMLLKRSKNCPGCGTFSLRIFLPQTPHRRNKKHGN
jgi:predicted negative regulator of RcsB-dependent stress response